MAVNENKWGLLYCPRGGWRSAKRWEKIEKVLRQQGVDYDFVQSENQKSVERLVKMFVNNGYKTIVIVGGDSALNDAVNCLMQMDASERNEVALGVIPNGLNLFQECFPAVFSCLVCCKAICEQLQFGVV